MANVFAPTTAGGVVARDFNAIQSQSVASILCIVVSEPIPLIPTSEPAQHGRSGPGPGPIRTRERLKHPAGRGALSEETTQAESGSGVVDARARARGDGERTSALLQVLPSGPGVCRFRESDGRYLRGTVEE